MTLKARIACLLLIVAPALASQAQMARKVSATPLKFSRNPAGDLTVTAPFSIRMSAPGFPSTEVPIQAQPGLLHFTCTWEHLIPLQVSITGAAGHGLPGRIGLASQIGQSPLTIDVQVGPEQVARGPIYVEIFPSLFHRSHAEVHGTIVATVAAEGQEKFEAEERLDNAIREGPLLSASEVSAMEAKLKSDPRDWSVRLSLLTYYSSSALAEELSARAVSLDPYNPQLLWPLLQVLSVEVGTAETGGQKIDAEKKIYGLIQHLNDIASDPADRTVLLPVLANLALDINDDQAAKTYATEALDLASRLGGQSVRGIEAGPEAIHDANDVLGRVALRAGNLQQAKDYLLKAPAVSGAHMWSARSPRMTLAQALLDRGEVDTVVQYLEEMKSSWKSGSFLLQHWIDVIRKSRTKRVNLLGTPPSALLY